jgi:hypothetical protein
MSESGISEEKPRIRLSSSLNFDGCAVSSDTASRSAA